MLTVTFLLLLFRWGIHSRCCAFKICSYFIMLLMLFCSFLFRFYLYQITINNINKLSNHFTHLYIRRQVCGGCCSPCCRVAVNVNVMLYGWRESCVRGRGREREREQKRENSRAQATRERKAEHRVAAADLLLLVLLLLSCSCCGCYGFAVNFTALLHLPPHKLLL